MRCCAPLVFTLLLAGSSAAAQDSLQISLANDAESERATRQQLLRLLREHDVSPWIYTRQIVIDYRSTPHSHPVLTLHTRHLREDLHLLSTFVHEQFHWLAIEKADATQAAITEFRQRFPEAPAGGPAGARDQHSTYLHLVVCDLEFQAMTRLVGEQRARETLSKWTHYTWIYDRVLNDPVVRQTTTKHGLLIPAASKARDPKP
jgi:hypothetical protein